MPLGQDEIAYHARNQFHCPSLQQPSEAKNTDLHDTMSPYQQSKHNQSASGFIRKQQENFHSWASAGTCRKRRRPFLVHLEEGLQDGELRDRLHCDSHVCSLKKMSEPALVAACLALQL
ncbi:hypothetical protein NC651_027010 [Populus alba x Populus x berolinensis]|nr:hypothetical protein NC651_027010 [Populus alba x Populus x berolinensis]